MILKALLLLVLVVGDAVFFVAFWFSVGDRCSYFSHAAGFLGDDEFHCLLDSVGVY